MKMYVVVFSANLVISKRVMNIMLKNNVAKGEVITVDYDVAG